VLRGLLRWVERRQSENVIFINVAIAWVVAVLPFTDLADRANPSALVTRLALSSWIFPSLASLTLGLDSMCSTQVARLASACT